jgi:putative hydrolase of the HAD superfamily
MNAVRGVIFDLFHTLTAREIESSDVRPACEILGVDRPTWDHVVSDGSLWRIVGEVREPYGILRRLAHQIDPTIDEERVRLAVDMRLRRFAQVLQRIPPANLDALGRLRSAGMRLALLSNADAMEAAEFARSPLRPLFDVVVFSCEAGCAKPEPEIFAACLGKLGLGAHECVFVGDGGSDELRGAKAVGLRTVFVSGVIEDLWPEKVSPRREIADHHVRWVPEVLALLGIAAPAEAS